MSKICKKGYIEIKKNYLETLKSVLGRSILHYLRDFLSVFSQNLRSEKSSILAYFRPWKCYLRTRLFQIFPEQAQWRTWERLFLELVHSYMWHSWSIANKRPRQCWRPKQLSSSLMRGNKWCSVSVIEAFFRKTLNAHACNCTKKYVITGVFLWIYLCRSSLPEVLCKKNCSFKFRKIHRKTHVSESLFNKFADLRPATLLKKDSGTGVFLRILRNFLKHLLL